MGYRISVLFCFVLRQTTLHIALLCDLGNSVAVHRELGSLAGSADLQDRIELTVNQNIGVTTDWGGEVRVQRDVERIVTILRYVEHARAEVLRTLGSLLQQDLHDTADGGIGDRIQRTHKGTRR